MRMYPSHLGILAAIALFIGVNQLCADNSYYLVYGPLGSYPPGTLVWVPSSHPTDPASNPLGPYGNESVTFFGMDLWADVPGHGFLQTNVPWRLTISFDLVLAGTWYGNGDATHVPSIFDFTDYSPYTGERTATLLHTTFSCGASPYSQAYPGSFPSGAYPPGTGSIGDPSVYHLSYEVPDLGWYQGARDYDLFLRLSASGLGGT